jgi:hypothetical protein
MAAAALAPNIAMAEAVVNVPFNFTVDGKVCPAGQYTVDRDPIKNLIVLRGAKAPVGFNWFLTPGNEDRKPTSVVLHFTQNNEKFSLSTVEYGRMTTHQIEHKSKRSSRELERVVQGQGQ